MHNSKLITRIKGGLGNQLFCYAVARRLALTNEAELVIDDVSGFAYDKKYQRKYALDAFNITARKATPYERLLPFSRLRRAVISRIAKIKPLAKRRYILQNNIEFDSELLDLRLQPGTTYFDGFGQSERYFLDFADIIRSDLAIKPPPDRTNQDVAKSIAASEAVALHVRWFDSENSNSCNNMSLDYYKKSIDRILGFSDKPHFFIFSDNTAATGEKLQAILNEIPHTFVNHNSSESMAYADLWLMSLCQHFVIANSTFGWWAAWLGEQKGKSYVIAPAVIIKPSTNITAWGFDGLIPERWILI